MSVADRYDDVLESWSEAEDKLRTGERYSIVGTPGSWSACRGEQRREFSSLFDALDFLVNGSEPEVKTL